MQFQVAVAGFENQNIAIEAPNLFSAAKLLINGQPAAPGEKRGEFKLLRDDGKEVIARFKSFLLDPVPQLVVDGATVHLAEPLPWQQLIFAYLPLVMLLTGNVIGALFGVAASVMNLRLFGLKRSLLMRYTLCSLNIIATVSLYKMTTVALFMMAAS